MAFTIPKKEVRLKPWVPAGEVAGPSLPVALILPGTDILPGQIKLWDVLILPKSFAEVVQVVSISAGGTMDEAWNVLTLPRSAGSGTAWRLSVKSLNGAPDITGQHRPLAVIRVGKEINLNPVTAVLQQQETGTVLVVRGMNDSKNPLTGFVYPLNASLFTLAKRLPVLEAELSPEQKT